MKLFQCNIDLANNDHHVTVVDKNGYSSEIITTKFKFKGDLIIQKVFSIPIVTPGNDTNAEKIIHQSHTYDIYENPSYIILMRSISYKNESLEIIPEYRNSLVNIMVLPKEIPLTFPTLFNFYFYNDQELKNISLNNILVLAEFFEIETAFELN